MAERKVDRLGTEIRHARRAKGWSQADLASAVGKGLTREVLANIETGRRARMSIDLLCGIADTLGVTPNDILGYSVEARATAALTEISRLVEEALR